MFGDAFFKVGYELNISLFNKTMMGIERQKLINSLKEFKHLICFKKSEFRLPKHETFFNHN